MVSGASALTRIAVDAMGGDHGPAVVAKAVAGALEADTALRILLFGDPEAVEAATRRAAGVVSGRLATVTCEHHVSPEASPARALRNSQGTSMAEALDALAGARADALVSAGNTGALMALARARLGMLPGIERPALMSAFPAGDHRVWVLDLGANLSVDARRLFEFAVLGSAAVSILIGRQPSVGLLNVGHEPSKGPDVVREAARLLAASDIDYIGFIEGHQVFSGRAEVVVCDGFAGNVLLKGAEGAVEMVMEAVEREFSGPLAGKLARARLRRLRERLEPGVHNGASLLGINGIVVKSHGRAGTGEFARAIRLAAREVRGGMLPALERQLWDSA